jgi:hypothetical protein
MSETYQLQPMTPRCWKIDKDGTEHWQCERFFLFHPDASKARKICLAMMRQGKLRSWQMTGGKRVGFTFSIEMNEPLDWITKSVKVVE